ncbi:Peptidase dimerization domain-containing protein [Sodalis praecaptivus]|uniref:Peptidase dimerization domain-containing protein n=1 Tax=Sodalis praecaptivus TaxID=1239307 RepID=W0HWP4_9GAMM|nr:dipeptidase [Sodalis praecaptivus]AHF76625.1 Peptidase dimerization domain-containing protein [Sodalis praecaptivus]
MNWPDYLQQHQPAFIAQLTALLRIPSVSADPALRPEVWRCARWLAQRLTDAGLEAVSVDPAGDFPMLYGEWLHAAGAPTILIYGHFDVQPPGEAQLWRHPPFEPWIEQGRLYGRGASDDKGNLLAPVLAIEAMLRTLGRLPVNVKVLLEGQEEILSPDLPAFIHRHQARLACDLAVSADGWQWSETEADLRTGLRGLCALEVTVTGPRQELHAGSHGGAVANPIQALATLIAGLHDAEGRVRVPGFYRDVRPLTAAERAALRAIPFSAADYLARTGAPALVGEAGFSALERIGARPTLEVNGITGGYRGPGVMTIIPAHASAKITCRLVPDQQPDAIAQAVADALRQRAPAGVRVTVTVLPNAARPYRMALDHPGNVAAARVLRRLYGREPYYTKSGGSIAILALLEQTLGVATVIFGFGLPDENFHAPNEFFRLAQFARAQLAWGQLLEELAVNAR